MLDDFLYDMILRLFPPFWQFLGFRYTFSVVFRFSFQLPDIKHRWIIHFDGISYKIGKFSCVSQIRNYHENFEELARPTLTNLIEEIYMTDHWFKKCLLNLLSNKDLSFGSQHPLLSPNIHFHIHRHNNRYQKCHTWLPKKKTTSILIFNTQLWFFVLTPYHHTAILSFVIPNL